MKKSLSFLYVAMAAVLWGSISLYYKPLIEVGFSPLQIVLMRVSVASVGMAAYIFFTDKSLFRIRLKDVWLFIGTGIVSVAFFNFCYFTAMQYLAVSVAASLLYTAPVFVMILSCILFEEVVTVCKVVVVLVAFLGCTLVTGVLENDQTVSWIGILFGVGSGIGYALYSIFGVYALRRYPTKTVTFYTFVFATIVAVPSSDVAGMLQVTQEHVLTTVFCSLGIGVLACILPYVCYTKGLESMAPSNASIIATLEPLIAAIIGILVWKDDVNYVKIIGIAVIVLSILISNLPYKKNSKQ